MINFTCSACRKKLRVKNEAAGKTVKCPGCGQQAAIPALAASRTPEGEGVQGPGGGPVVDVTGALLQSTPAMDATIDAGPGTHSDDQGAVPANFLGPPHSSDELGRLGPFRVLKVLGQGGMGLVFQAEDVALDRLVAIKTLLPALAANPRAKERFLREARLAAKIEHEHIISIHRVDEDRGVPYLAMPLLQGRPLNDFLREQPRLASREAARIGREMAEGLSAAHAKGMIHRDIKPGNIWLEGDKRKVKILDFGLARTASDITHLTQSGAIVGTPAYMAPEQARGGAVDARADLFSLGCVLYEMVAGRRAFSGNDTMSILTSLALDTPTSPHEVNSAVSEDLSAIVMKLLEKNPDDRFASAAEVADALHAVETASPATMPQMTAQAIETQTSRTAIKRPSNPQTASATARRPTRRGLYAVLAVGALAAAVLAMILPALLRRERPADGSPDNESDVSVKTPSVVRGPNNRSMLFVWLSGGPSQIDTFDPKPGSANSIFKAIETSAPGIQFAETMPMLAKQAHHLAVIRSMQHRLGDHAQGSSLMKTGCPPNQSIDYPHIACVVGKELARPGVPRWVRFQQDASDSGFLGVENEPVVLSMTKEPGLSEIPKSAGKDAAAFHKVAVDAYRASLNLERRRRFPADVSGHRALSASRLLQAGVPVVELMMGGWDNHKEIKTLIQKPAHAFDESLAALISDLEASGRLKDTLIVAMGEFGRTPLINVNGGRDHYPHGFSVVLGGGLVRGGQIVGKTSSDGTTILERPVSVEDLHATIYAALGIDPAKTHVGPNGTRIPYTEPGARPIAELLPVAPPP